MIGAWAGVRFWRRKTGKRSCTTACRWRRSGQRSTSSRWWRSATTSCSTCLSLSSSKDSQSTATWVSFHCTVNQAQTTVKYRENETETHVKHTSGNSHMASHTT